MSETIGQFFSKGGIKKFRSGADAFLKRHANRIAAVSMVLSSAFAVSGHAADSGSDKDSQAITAFAVNEKGDTLCAYKALQTDSASFVRLQNLVNKATNTPTGAGVLKALSKQGTVLNMSDAGARVIGYFHPGENSICLNTRFGDDNLQSCLIHEGKHSMQAAKLKREGDAYYDFFTNVMRTRVMEGDAMATQTKFSYELAERGDSTCWKALEKSHSVMTKALKENAGKYGIDDKKTMKETMLSWYDDKAYAGIYDRSTADFHARVALSADSTFTDCFSKKLDADMLVRKVCRTVDGKCYAGHDGSLLKTKRTAYMSQDVYQYAQGISDLLYTRTGKKDLSSNDFYVLHQDGTTNSKTYGQAKKAAEETMKVVKKKYPNIIFQQNQGR